MAEGDNTKPANAGSGELEVKKVSNLEPGVELRYGSFELETNTKNLEDKDGSSTKMTKAGVMILDIEDAAKFKVWDQDAKSQEKREAYRQAQLNKTKQEIETKKSETTTKQTKTDDDSRG